MAPTLQEIIAKRNELGLSNNIEAKKALESTQTPVTPPTPIAPTVNIREQMAGKTVEERQAIRNGQPVTPPTTPVTPAPIVNAPIDPTTGLSKPLETTPAPTQAPTTPAPVVEPVKTEPVVDFNKSQGREQEIMSNLEKFKTQ